MVCWLLFLLLLGNVLTRSDIWKGSFDLAPNVRGAVHHGERGMVAGTRGSWSHIVSAAMNGEMNAGVLAFSVFPSYSV